MRKLCRWTIFDRRSKTGFYAIAIYPPVQFRRRFPAAGRAVFGFGLSPSAGITSAHRPEFISICRRATREAANVGVRQHIR